MKLPCRSQPIQPAWCISVTVSWLQSNTAAEIAEPRVQSQAEVQTEFRHGVTLLHVRLGTRWSAYVFVNHLVAGLIVLISVSLPPLWRAFQRP
jgi:hypothetical protein